MTGFRELPSGSVAISTRWRAAAPPGVDCGGGGTLFLHVGPGGSKSWVQRLTVNGWRRDIGLGAWPLVSLAQAREKAFDNRRLARSGGDPFAQRRRADMPTFREATMRTLEVRKPRWRNEKHATSLLQTLEKHAFPVLGKMRVDQIERQDVLRVLTPIWEKIPETARRVRSRIKAVLAWCSANGFVEIDMAGEVIDGALPAVADEPVHLRAIPFAEIAHVMRTVEAGRGSRNAKLCFLFTVLTAARGAESRGARWDEIDFAERLWRLPAHRMKVSQPHDQPLSRAALAVLDRARALDDDSGLVFPSAQKRGAPLSNVAMMKLLAYNGLAERMTVHGCRATFRTWASECTDADTTVKEPSIAHTVLPKHLRPYDRAELVAKRRVLMEEWGDFAAAELSDPPVSGSAGESGLLLPERAALPADGAQGPKHCASSSVPVASGASPRRRARGRARSASAAPRAPKAQLGLFPDD